MSQLWKVMKKNAGLSEYQLVNLPLLFLFIEKT